MHQEHSVIAEQPIELVAEGSERPGLDLDQLLRWQVLVTDDVDYETMSRDLEGIPRSCVMSFQRCMQGTLVEGADAWLHEDIGGRGLIVCDTRS